MKMYLVLCYDPHARMWFAYSGALKTRFEAETEIRSAPKYDVNWREIKYRVLDFWMPRE